ncbi:MAG: calcium-translocating P-type ATPase, PMCA-type [Clostridia bacterium]|nr:calcium-translocating P-type ATPase, PMCA-type [Clostridia bacterium]
MTAHDLTARQTAEKFSSDTAAGLSAASVEKNASKYGANQISKGKKRGFFKRLFDALTEPTLVILEFAWIVTVGVNLGKYLKSGDGDILECIGILVAILISALLTVFMEGRSEKAFELLGSVYDRISVKVIREGKTLIVGREKIVAGDLVLLETGDKIIADGRLVTAKDLTVDESMLTGESLPVRKEAEKVLPATLPLAERCNCVFSGTFVGSGSGSMIVTAVGDNAELGKIASGLGGNMAVSAPLNQKLNRLGKTVTVIGAISSALVFALSVIRLFLTGRADFFTVQDAFVEAIVLIVAAVPEGLPTTAAISLTLNVVKLARSNALIRKLVAAETVGCVSVICSDKTGTLTRNKMCVSEIFGEGKEATDLIMKNAAINSTAIVKREKGKEIFFGSATECALLKECEKRGYDYVKMRKDALIGRVIPFDSAVKYMLTEDRGEGVTFVKGAPEVVTGLCAMSAEKSKRILARIAEMQAQSKRVIAFAHRKGEEYVYDGAAVISDPVRSDVKASVENCINAGIEVKMLTGDNAATAEAIARELGLIKGKEEVVTAAEIEKLSDSDLEKALPFIKVIARSTPQTKLKIVETLKRMGEVVAVTGDGVNDAPAIKHADIGIAMGSGSEITKEASDIVLLDDSFSTIVKAISFGRNIYRNFQRFIMFQLSVNLTAMVVVIISLALGFTNPFNAVQLLWIDIIMDGPPALTLGMENSGISLMNAKPVKRTDSIVTFNMLLRIILHAAFMGAAVTAEILYDYLGAGAQGVETAVFSLFVMFQLFNAFNCRKTGSESIFSSVGSNKPMVFVFGATFLLQILIAQVFCGFFHTVPLPIGVWAKIILTASTVVIFSEIYKFFYRHAKKGQKKVLKLSEKLN